MKYYIIILILVININTSFSQAPVEDKLGSWFTFVGNHKVSDKVSFSTLVQAWDYEVADNFNFILYNLSLNYKLTPKVTTSIAYGFADIDSGFETNKPHTFENRLSEQVGYKHKLFKLPIDHRFRIEQRFLNKSGPDVTHNRLRYRLGTKIELNKTLFLRIHNEYLTTIGSKKVDAFSENRFYTALGINASKSVNIQVGYLNRAIKKLSLHRLQLGLFYKMDLRKKKEN
ncbi:DUF2490 domain-containing protein [uncultured Algibacter sp.]|uniref:DUF2490 domain-containing protein n=1 Tax=uncultured Algibacter sp. TaxID=298659 RepID=UPI00260F7F69|nr:DUF2490 domain-containing protein [uncultured Algibacter sp.]